MILGPSYATYWHFAVEHPFAKRGFGPQEDRLLAGLMGSFMIPVRLFLYGKQTLLPDQISQFKQ